MINRALSVTEVNHFIKTMLDTNSVLKNIMIEGEISNLKIHSSGHIYFSLKDQQSRIACVMFKNNVQNLKFKPEEGMNIVIKGSISVFERSGQYQIYVRSMEPQGIGALYQAFEQLKAKLENLGWFLSEKKQELPDFVKSVGIVTSPTGAAIRDMISVIQRRNPQIHIVIYPTLVQGDGSAEGIVKGIRAFNNLENVDVIIIGRGGGSMEDLWAFNEEIVSAAIHHSLIPIISAVGHETDFTIADFVADLRAPTPSVAGELVSDNLTEWSESILRLKIRLFDAIKKKVQFNRIELESLLSRLTRNSPENQALDLRLYLDNLQDHIQRKFSIQVEKKCDKIANLEKRLEILNPENVLKRGFIVAKDNKGKLIHSAKEALEMKTITLKFQDGEMIVRVVKEEL
ncbi:MAG: exodeoxyribonuclease VII large subunit [Eubacterium sp.]